MSAALSDEFSQFIATRVESGRYRSAEDVLNQAFALLEEKERLLERIDAGTRQLRSGEFSEYSIVGLRALFDTISRDGWRRLKPS